MGSYGTFISLFLLFYKVRKYIHMSVGFLSEVIDQFWTKIEKLYAKSRQTAETLVRACRYRVKQLYMKVAVNVTIFWECLAVKRVGGMMWV
jgi:hypothetical protein